MCIVLASNSAFIAASANSSVSFWDTTTHTQIGSVIEHTDLVTSMAISANYNIAISGGKIITLYDLAEHFPSPYSDIVSLKSLPRDMASQIALFYNRYFVSGKSRV